MVRLSVWDRMHLSLSHLHPHAIPIPWSNPIPDPSRQGNRQVQRMRHGTGGAVVTAVVTSLCTHVREETCSLVGGHCNQLQTRHIVMYLQACPHMGVQHVHCLRKITQAGTRAHTISVLQIRFVFSQVVITATEVLCTATPAGGVVCSLRHQGAWTGIITATEQRIHSRMFSCTEPSSGLTCATPQDGVPGGERHRLRPSGKHRAPVHTESGTVGQACGQSVW